MRGLLIPVGSEIYVIPLTTVTEVATALRLTRLVTASSTVLGLINLRGELIPLFDTAALLGSGEDRPVQCAVVVGVGEVKAALAVSGMPHIEDIGADVGQATIPSGITTHVLAGGHMAVLLDVEQLLAPGAGPQ